MREELFTCQACHSKKPRCIQCGGSGELVREVREYDFSKPDPAYMTHAERMVWIVGSGSV